MYRGWHPLTVLRAEAARPRRVREYRRAPWFAVATVCFGAFMGQLDASVVTLAFPALQHGFGVGLAAVQWVSLGYLLALVALLVPVGRWSDRWGRKLVYLYGFVIFTAASTACGFAAGLPELVGLRVVQAMGAAMLQANSVALVVTTVPDDRRRAALGVQAAAQSFGLAAGPTVGGVLVASVGWRWIFWINVPVGVLAVIAGWFLLPRTRGRAEREGADPLGVALLAVASAGVLLAASSAAGLRLPGWATVALLLIGVGAGGVLMWWQRHAHAPLLDLRMLARGPVGAGLSGALAAYLVLFGPLVLFPQILTGPWGSARAGLVLTALPAGFGLAAVASERLLPGRWSDRRRGTIGGLLACVAALALAVGGPLPATVVGLGLLGIGLGMYIPANNSAIMAAVPAPRAATVGGMVNMARGLGTALGVAVVSLTLHLGRAGGHRASVALSMGILAAVALWAVAAARLAGARHRSDPTP